MSERVPDWQSQVMASTGIGQKVKQLEWQVQLVSQEAKDPVQPAWKQSLVITQGSGLWVSLEWAGSKSKCKGWHGYANCFGYMLSAVYMTIFVWTARLGFSFSKTISIGFILRTGRYYADNKIKCLTSVFALLYPRHVLASVFPV